MTGEVWSYIASKPNDDKQKVRPVLVVGNDANNQLKYVDIHYVIISSSAECGIYDVRLEEEIGKSIGLQRTSVIKTTKLYTGPKSKLGLKIGELPDNKKKEFIEKYRSYQENIISQFFIDKEEQI